jgi:hypothetical protein
MPFTDSSTYNNNNHYNPPWTSSQSAAHPAVHHRQLPTGQHSATRQQQHPDIAIIITGETPP